MNQRLGDHQDLQSQAIRHKTVNQAPNTSAGLLVEQEERAVRIRGKLYTPQATGGLVVYVRHLLLL